MDINELCEMQVKLDELHGFPVRFKDVHTKYDQLTKDLVGLFGEVGEFSNIIKKINIKLSRPNEYDLDLARSEKDLAEELVDALIYIIRIGAILEVDLQAELLNKIKSNESRYAKLRQK